MKGKFHTKHGFTMIEVMVVIVILGVLSAIGVPKIIGYTEKTKEKADLMKLYYLRDALNKAIIINGEALYNSSYLSSGDESTNQKNRDKLKGFLENESGVTLFVIEMKGGASMNVQASHGSANNTANMCELIGDAGTWYDALKEARFEGVADIVAYRKKTNNNTGIKNDVEKNGKSHSTFTVKEDGSNWRTYPNTPMFISSELNYGKAAGLDKITSQGNNKTNYRLTMSFQWTGAKESSHSIEVALLPNGAKMYNKSNGRGGAFLTDRGVCFSTYGDRGCADYKY
ncbi:type II secretion system protein [Fibrobacter succinogenes]|uniref:type II secretion system protein n=1 Tax=Fibrobacter succinogenes TaxID=833 RepID=UPI0013D26657|nr:type II secretion system protein [Fibrobacter succinogenes]MBO6076560.1 type II secretion system protein [Fibrobacter sp.]